VLFSVRISGHEALIYVLYEHQSSPDPLMGFRLLRYEVRIWETWLRDHPNTARIPAILPVVLHHGPDGWTAATSFEALLDLDEEALADVAEHVPRFRFLLDDLAGQDDEVLHARAITALGKLALLCFKHARDPDELVARLERWADVMREVWKAPNGVAALALVLRYIYEVGGERTIEALRELTTRQLGKDAEEAIVSYAQQLRDEGERKGRREGRVEGHSELLLKLLRVRFGELPEGIAKRVATAALDQIDRWGERVLTAASLDEVFAG
jgi:hypothetical protein